MTRSVRSTGLRLTAAVLAGLMVVGLGVAAFGRMGWPRVVIGRAEQALRRHDVAGARAILDQYLDGRPADSAVLFLAARSARRGNDVAEAERLIGQLDALRGPTDASRLEWSLLGAQQGDYSGEEDVLLRRADRGHSETEAILEALARGFYFARRWPDAATILDQLINRDPNHAPALVLRGTVSDRLRQADAAAADFRRAIAVAPGYAPGHAALADHLNHAGRPREALPHYDLASRLDPTDAATALGMARALADEARPADAAGRLDEFLGVRPNHPDGLVERGRLALRLGRPDKAAEFLARAAHVAPWHRDGSQLGIAALGELGRTAEAAEWAARVDHHRREDAELGRLSLRFKDTPGDVAIRYDLGRWYLRNGQPETGAGWLASALRVDPRHGPTHVALAEYFDRAGQPRRAAQHRSAPAGAVVSVPPAPERQR
jgi:Tfp pilus assembly protein PilF